ncbi:16S rRNA (guanine(527)-N(7))-methyltransferase RsmG [Terrihalobacillus insolitus]|uniref:16S rRNA (guanine(527)-N(7))-methyltransferase RsmG n=1 Tax=Terrihalobacillus insolitus TaxID=2950438 RepID=UPI00234160DE|nr:16S rRNA (guanine(527)-N(7))-methyltransferase RsmG [Terrihalobacillus insolitus]MDC3414916.1 16S rRNA (guanine(527)-N(7))-methyltransferase RsmG [Terrihalobacillus insolitus]
MNTQTFVERIEQHGISINQKKQEQFALYFRTLIEWNEKMNLTAITEKEHVYVKHFFDSLSASFYYNFHVDTPVRLCDVGAGAGFPSIPLKIVFPNLKITIVDSLKKRITFLHELAETLGLDNVEFYHDRAETFGNNAKFREAYDVVTARAVARMSVLSELCLPLCRVGGTFIAMKGPGVQEELNDATVAINTLGGEVNNVVTFQLPDGNGERNIALIDKIKKTPKKYPRNPGVPNKSPLE